MTKKKKNITYKPSKWIFIILFTIPLIFCLLLTEKLDNDLWYLLSEGRYIFENGVYNIDPLSMHSGLHVVVQNWLSATIFWIIFDLFGQMGIMTMVLVCNFWICLLLYKICMLLSDRNYILSLVLMFATDITLISHFIVSRPQIFSFIVLLGLIYVLELYIKTENKKYLVWLPILSLIEVNMHASLWWMLFLFILPYVIDSFKCDILQTEGYKKRPLFIAIATALLVGFINPYGYKAITFIFTSYGDKYMHLFINELLPFTFTKQLCKHMFALILVIGLIYTFFREGKIRVRYICLFCGTMLLGFMSVKGFNTFILVAIFPLAYFFKDMFPKDFSDLKEDFPKLTKILGATIGIICILGFSAMYFIKCNTNLMENNAKEAMDLISESFNPEKMLVYSSFNDGGYVEFRGFKPYIDPRAELYLKKNNKKADIFKEFYDLQHNLIDKQNFLDKYQFDILLLNNTDILYSEMINLDGYFIVYDNTVLGYQVYLKNELFDDEKRGQIIDSYNKALQEKITNVS
ncbi:MAG: hypothetical protein E7167_02560 [Firmicutes bacterium]|nr:hypothetical protein [Bacillota bacterium]